MITLWISNIVAVVEDLEKQKRFEKKTGMKSSTAQQNVEKNVLKQNK